MPLLDWNILPTSNPPVDPLLIDLSTSENKGSFYIYADDGELLGDIILDADNPWALLMGRANRKSQRIEHVLHIRWHRLVESSTLEESDRAYAKLRASRLRWDRKLALAYEQMEQCRSVYRHLFIH